MNLTELKRKKMTELIHMGGLAPWVRKRLEEKRAAGLLR